MHIAFVIKTHCGNYIAQVAKIGAVLNNDAALFPIATSIATDNLSLMQRQMAARCTRDTKMMFFPVPLAKVHLPHTVVMLSELLATNKAHHAAAA